jgi:hypothetical protein
MLWIMSQPPYYPQPPFHQGYDLPVPRPGVISWFIFYCVVMTLMYLLVAAFGVLLLVIEPDDPDFDAQQAKIMGLIFVPLGLVLMAACALPLLMPKRPWLWVYDLILICLGLTSICFWPICIPLLIFWIKPQTKAYFAPPAAGYPTG